MRIIAPTALSLLLCTPLLVNASEYSPYVDEDFPRNLYWGDTHLHSSFSMDASIMGNAALPPAAAFQFARGETVTANNGMRVRLQVPLDFLVVADHAEHMGILPKLREGAADILADPIGQRLYETLTNNPDGSSLLMGELLKSTSANSPIIANDAIERSVWEESASTADAFNDPGTFTTLIGYEWSSMPGADNLHRVVVFADAADKVTQIKPFSSFDSEQPEKLWAFLADYEAKTGGRALAIPHNSNISNGRMFAVEDSDGQPFNREYAVQRMRWEPIIEVTQIKGDGEAHPWLSPDDEFANFETWDFGNFGALEGDNKENYMLQHEYARSALKLGLQQQALLGVNPFKFGMIGSTDSHTSLATAAEENFFGKSSTVEPGSNRTYGSASSVASKSGNVMFMPWEYAASGYTGVWARDNTREELFAALQRKEVYATTGSRIAVRLFGGWQFSAADINRPDRTRHGYASGVPMGQDLPTASGEQPGFMVYASKDPNGANLDRIQIVKGWLDTEGELHEQVYNVAASDQRRIRRNKVKPLKSTVDAASYSNSIGEATLAAFWEDPDFELEQSAFYYARVIEIPTPRWPAYDAARLGAKIDAAVPLEVQDRAYTSPIWYTPATDTRR
ncbi:DUF3604 domain-containing protein [Halieaceae bacterium IMCC14734]|uniref:DUF3604 domain-containing protein n=1 Tax=Candidatus Litorirhabdus singularis TaxID=2518993 RepID=A0ABT3TIX0_9GAMM|nr:DUF3604 domain-containing protein [Candidatus Litorirhabdus singularis]MCX2982263.1 DUF3604 domain-containing protein [Candidatus Litorirhabdus singularis]